MDSEVEENMHNKINVFQSLEKGQNEIKQNKLIL